MRSPQAAKLPQTCIQYPYIREVYGYEQDHSDILDLFFIISNLGYAQPCGGDYY